MQDAALEDRKKLQVYLQFIPGTAKEAMYEKLPLYLQVAQAVAQLDYAAIKPQLNVLFQSFNLAFQKCQYDFEKIALLRQILKIYSAAVNNHASQQDLAPLNNLLQAQSQSSNQTIQTLSTIHLITSTKDPNTIVKLSVLLPSLSGELKHSALELIMTLTSQPQVYNFLVPILQKFLKSQDSEIRKVGFQSISEIIKKTDDAPLKTRLTHQLIENFDDTDDPVMSRQLCAQLTSLNCETEDEARALCVGLWQRALLDGAQIRLAAI